MIIKIKKRDGRNVTFNIEKIAGAIYKAATAASVTLNNLTANHRYLVQFWVVDTRDNDSVRSRYVEIDGVGKVYFQGAGGLGSYVIGKFAADSSSYTINLSYGSDGGISNSTQINAIQVRDLGPVADALPESGTVTTALTGAGLVKSSSAELSLAAAAPRAGRHPL